MKRHGIVARPGKNLGATFNPAAARVGPAEFVMLARDVPKGYQKTGPVNQFDDNYKSQISLWRGKAPDRFRLANATALAPDRLFDRFGVEDPRITKIGDKWYIFYTALARGLGQKDAADGIRIAMASTKDFKTFAKHGVIGPDRVSKAGILFESVGRLHFIWKDEQNVERTMLSPAPDDFENPEAWRKMWDDPAIAHRQLLGPQDNPYEGHGVEPGAPPIEIDEGLLLVYSSIAADFKWSISAMLLDKQDPGKILAKTDAPILIPETPYELAGDVNNVVFPCGALIDEGRLYIYYGAADTVCAVASEDMSVIRQQLKPFQDHPVPGLRP